MAPSSSTLAQIWFNINNTASALVDQDLQALTLKLKELEQPLRGYLDFSSGSGLAVIDSKSDLCDSENIRVEVKSLRVDCKDSIRFLIPRKYYLDKVFLVSETQLRRPSFTKIGDNLYQLHCRITLNFYRRYLAEGIGGEDLREVVDFFECVLDKSALVSVEIKLTNKETGVEMHFEPVEDFEVPIDF